TSNNAPWRDGSFLKEYEEDAKAAGLAAVNCVPEYFAEGGHDHFRLLDDPYHLNQEGNALIAQTTLRWLKKDPQAARLRPDTVPGTVSQPRQNDEQERN